MFTVARFSKKSIVMGSFISQKTVRITFFTNCFARNLSISSESVCLNFKDSLFDAGSLR